MPKDLTRENAVIGATLYEWEIQEYEPYQRDRRWYIIAGVIGSLFLVYALFTGNNLFFLIVLLLAIIIYLQAVQKPLTLMFAITENGVIVGRKFYNFKEIQNFWILYDPPQVKNLYLRTNIGFKNVLQIPLYDYDPQAVQAVLLQYVAQDTAQEDESLSTKIMRVLKI